jgi:hypothetical protein
VGLSCYRVGDLEFFADVVVEVHKRVLNLWKKVIIILPIGLERSNNVFNP